MFKSSNPGWRKGSCGLGLGLQPVRGLVQVEPRWRQEAQRLVRAGVEDRGARRKGECLKIGEGLPATLAAIAAIGRSKLPPMLRRQGWPMKSGNQSWLCQTAKRRGCLGELLVCSDQPSTMLERESQVTCVIHTQRQDQGLIKRFSSEFARASGSQR